MPRPRSWLYSAGALLSLSAAAGSAPLSTPVLTDSPPRVTSGKLKPRARLVAGDRWRVRVSQYLMHLPEPDWTPPETWVFSVPGLEKTKEGQRFVVTATREGASKPTVRMELDPDTHTVLRIDITTPVQGSEQVMVERPTPGEAFVSELSPVPLAFAWPGAPGSQEAVAGNSPPTEERLPVVRTGQQPLAFVFDRRLNQRLEPVDASVGRARIEQGLSGLHLTRRAGLEPAGVPRYATIIEGPGLRVEQIWDETTPWPLFIQTDTSRSWLVAFTKGKS
jgi:hypothetical protein